MKLSNRWNRSIYRFWSPVYDYLAGRLFVRSRKRAIEILNLQPGERALLVGVGTGLDIPLLRSSVRSVGLDLTSTMLGKARKRSSKGLLVIGDAQALPFPDGSFDSAILTLILSVVPDGAACLQETARVLRPGGRAVILDKFLPEGERPSRSRRLLNVLTSFFGTDINRRLGDMMVGLDCTVEREEPSLFGGAYKIVLVRKPEGG